MRGFIALSVVVIALLTFLYQKSAARVGLVQSEARSEDEEYGVQRDTYPDSFPVWTEYATVRA